MGTRNLTMVIHDGQIKLAKYGQWDGDISSLGSDILKVLRSKKFDPAKFIVNLGKVKILSVDEANARLAAGGWQSMDYQGLQWGTSSPGDPRWRDERNVFEIRVRQ